MPFWDRCCYPNRGRGGREAFSLLIVKFYCSLERLLANTAHGDGAESPGSPGAARAGAVPRRSEAPGAARRPLQTKAPSQPSARRGGRGRS